MDTENELAHFAVTNDSCDVTTKCASERDAVAKKLNHHGFIIQIHFKLKAEPRVKIW